MFSMLFSFNVSGFKKLVPSFRCARDMMQISFGRGGRYCDQLLVTNKSFDVRLLTVIARAGTVRRIALGPTSLLECDSIPFVRMMFIRGRSLLILI